MILIHASCVAIDGQGVLICGDAGAGKSDLALRLIDDGATLVADDYCEVSAVNDAAEVAPPARIAGLLEVRGIGVMKIPYLPRCRLALLVDVMPWAEIPRLPDRTTAPIVGVNLPWIMVDPTTTSATARVRTALRYGLLSADTMLPEAQRA